jgi:hypothetical protein
VFWEFGRDCEGCELNLKLRMALLVFFRGWSWDGYAWRFYGFSNSCCIVFFLSCLLRSLSEYALLVAVDDGVFRAEAQVHSVRTQLLYSCLVLILSLQPLLYAHGGNELLCLGLRNLSLGKRKDTDDWALAKVLYV